MPTYFRDRIHSPLSRADAEALVAELEELLLDALPDDEEELEETYDDAIAVSGELEMEVVEEAPPANADQALARANATGYAERSFVFEPAAMALLPACRSTIAIRYPHYLREMPAFVAVMKRMFARTGPGTVVDGETTYETAETWGAGFGDPWKETGAMQSRAELEAEERARREAERPKVKRREAKPGEAEALLLHEKLTKIIEGKDPLLRNGLRKALERTTENVRTYGAALLELGPKPDAALATAIGRQPAEVVEARETLDDLLDDLLED